MGEPLGDESGLAVAFAAAVSTTDAAAVEAECRAAKKATATAHAAAATAPAARAAQSTAPGAAATAPDARAARATARAAAADVALARPGAGWAKEAAVWSLEAIVDVAWRQARAPRAALAVDGVLATSLVCWAHVAGRPCDCGGARAHVFAGACGGAVAAALGVEDRKRRCTRGACKRPHPDPGAVVGAVVAWRAGRGGAAVAAYGGAGPSAAERPARGRAEASLEDAPPRACGTSAAALTSRLRRKSAALPRLAAFLAADFYDEAVADGAIRRLLATKGAPKEVCEAYAAADALRGLAAPIPEDELAILDVCSGRGVVALLLSYLFPRARVVMFDSNPAMDLSHVRSRANVAYAPLDVFSRAAPAELGRAARGRRAVLLGLHVCGSLAPRVLAVAADCGAVEAFAVVPCCTKGTLGKRAKGLAKAQGRNLYDVLADALLGVCRRDCPDARLDFAPDMGSPKNAVVTARKRPR